ncbi:MAG: ferredoxin [Woeseiaceae bacterium]
MNSVTDNTHSAEPDPTGSDSAADIVDRLRRFHYGEPAAVAATGAPLDGILPALLNPYRDASSIRYQYPLYLAPPTGETDAPLAKPLSDYLAESLNEMAPDADQDRILKDNLAWLERHVRRSLSNGDPVDAPGTFRAAADALQEHLGLNAASREQLESGLIRLQAFLAEGGVFLAYSPSVPLHLLLHTIRHQREQRREQYREEIVRCSRGLTALLDVENAKSADAGAPGKVKDSVGSGASHFDTGALSGMLEKRSKGSVQMSAERRARIERALDALQSWEESPAVVRIAGRIGDPYFSEQSAVDIVESADPCSTAGEMFDDNAARFARLFIAVRIARLEMDDGYVAAVHDSWFADFDWQAFTDEELQLATPIVALVSADYLATDGLPAFSRLLGSRRPVHVLSWVRAYDNPGAESGDGPFDAYRFELAYFGIGHRQVVVAQTSAARHENLLAGFNCALGSNRASLHLINRGTQTRAKKPLLDAWFVASAALESRAHPFILINPAAGDRSAERVSFDGNPQADRDWPVETLEYRNAGGDVTEMRLAFTFADYALLMPALHEHFRVIPAGVNSAELVPIDEYLALDEDAAERQLPCVWGIDANGVLVQLVVSRALVFACRDRLNYWRTLQELAGIHNFYVEAAIERVIEEQRAADALEREQLQKTHEEQLESVRSEAADKVMGQLVDVLMGGDLASIVGGSAPPTKLPTQPAATPAPEPEAKDEAQTNGADDSEDALSFDEPWLDTAMCTTCDDCMGVNKMMFAYNDNKQAILRDPKAGPYADLVKAAEICPAKCIHPGKPLDPNEPGLEELVARAEPFN